MNLPKCATDQVVQVKLGKHQMTFRDGHVLDKKCIGDPCEIRIHAIASMVAYCANVKRPLCDLELKIHHAPCAACAVLLASAKPKKVIVEHCPEVTQKEMELLAVVVPTEVLDEGSAVSA